VVAEHRRCWSKGEVTFDPLHYLALLERKPFALDHARPLAGWSLPECFTTLRQRLEEADPKDGTRHYIRVLRLLERHELASVSAAVAAALKLAAFDADAVRLLLEKSLERPVADYDTAGRPHLNATRLAVPDLSAYAALMGAARSQS
jgi:hypothetical protein